MKGSQLVTPLLSGIGPLTLEIRPLCQVHILTQSLRETKTAPRNQGRSQDERGPSCWEPQIRNCWKKKNQLCRILTLLFYLPKSLGTVVRNGPLSLLSPFLHLGLIVNDHGGSKLFISLLGQVAAPLCMYVMFAVTLAIFAQVVANIVKTTLSWAAIIGCNVILHSRYAARRMESYLWA